MYLIEIIDGLVLPYIISLGMKLSVEFAIQVPIREQRVKEIVAKYIVALVLEAITPRPLLTFFLTISSLSPCSQLTTTVSAKEIKLN